MSRLTPSKQIICFSVGKLFYPPIKWTSLLRLMYDCYVYSSLYQLITIQIFIRVSSLSVRNFSEIAGVKFFDVWNLEKYYKVIQFICVQLIAFFSSLLTYEMNSNWEWKTKEVIHTFTCVCLQYIRFHPYIPCSCDLLIE